MGTIVTIVLLVSVLVLGVVLIKNIFTSAKGVVDLTDQQLREEINKLFSEDNALSVYPGTRFVEIKQTTTDGVGFGIRNIKQGAAGTTAFSYVVGVSDADLTTKCGSGFTKETAESWISTGRAESNIPIPSGDFAVQKVLFEIPVGSPLCTIRFRINVNDSSGAYATDFFDMKVKGK